MGQEVSPLWGPAGVPVNAGAGPHFDVLEIGHEDFVALINADTAFWVLAPRDQALAYLLGAELPQMFLEKEARLASDLNTVRFGLLPSAVYFNPTERCNLDCGYCYLPREARRAGDHMEPARLMESLEILQDFFESTLPEGARPQLVFHGAEPLLAKDAVFAGHREVRRLLPVRGADQRHPAGSRGQGLSGGPRRAASGCPWTAPPTRWPTAPGTPGAAPASSPRPSRSWRS